MRRSPIFLDSATGERVCELGMSLPEINPFSSRFTNPVDTVFVEPIGSENELVESGRSLVSLADQLDKGWGGQIVGRHGVGKSTLANQLATGCRNFDQIDSRVIRNDRIGHPKLAFPHLSVESQQSYSMAVSQTILPRRRLLIIDGVERLSMISRRLFFAAARLQRVSLLITTHRPVAGLPILCRLVASRNHFHQIVSQLQSAAPLRMDESAIDGAFDAADGNYRNALRLLYDRYQSLQEADRDHHQGA